MASYSGLVFAADFNTGGKNWSASFKASYIYDDNVVQTPDNSANRPAGLVGEGDSIFNWSASGSYQFKYDDKLSMTADYDVNMTTHFDLSAYDLTAQMFGLNPVYKFTDSFILSLRNWFVYNIVDGDDFSTLYIFHPSFNYMHPKLGMTRVHYTHTHTNHIANRFRTSQKNAWGIDQMFFFSNYRHYLRIGYEYAEEDSTLAFERAFHIFTISAKAELPYDLNLKLHYKNSELNYDFQLSSGAGLILRDDDRHKLDLKLEWTYQQKIRFIRRLRASLAYRHVSNESNLLVRDFTSNQIIIGVDAKF